VDLDYRLDLRDGKYKLLDFNPRIGAQFRLFQDEGDMDVARALHLDLTGRSVQQRDPRRRTFLVENHDLLASWGYHRDGSLSIRAWLQSLKSTDETAWFATDDLAPFLVMCMRFLVRGMQILLRIKPSADIRRRLPHYLPGRHRGGRRTARSDITT
jgi:predicted ATP-grasp superfamily ATP-dependent carboligase